MTGVPQGLKPRMAFAELIGTAKKPAHSKPASRPARNEDRFKELEQ